MWEPTECNQTHISLTGLREFKSSRAERAVPRGFLPAAETTVVINSRDTSLQLRSFLGNFQNLGDQSRLEAGGVSQLKIQESLTP